MAKSFHNIISEGTLEVTHQGNDIELLLPQVLSELKGKLMDKEMLLAWMDKNDIVLGVIHAGIQKIIIDVRAKARPAIDKDGKSKNIMDDELKAQERIDGFQIKPTLPPGSSQNPLKTAIKALKALGMDLTTITGILTDKFDSRDVEEMFKSLG